MTGIETIRMLYLQLLYRCNFNCTFCFHGERLSHNDSFSADEATALLRLMHETYGSEAVTLLGGEPFVYRELPQVVRHAKHDLGMQVEICTNGYRIERRLAEIAGDVDFLRISLEGIGHTNDTLRKRGSFAAALQSMEAARSLGVATGSTMTVNRQNIDEVIPLAKLLEDSGARQLKLHCLRPIGNAADHPELTITDTAAYARLREQLADAALCIDVVVDEDLSGEGSQVTCAPVQNEKSVERIESDPRGALTLSCKAVGKDAHAFWYDKKNGHIEYRPTGTDEIALAIPDVVYSHV
ncbi:radical SAM protein [Streptomyces albireticuli]|uniref:radical SAM protein n=1 Tax=Streptomyces albireticuli TaxID=1940 RepID=UPI001E60CF36|nr:radical SAM protein [Streptomyces albireticuli]MCD9141455.1 radical SAM protein [Streptomyces albireticuli]MCD9164294.1 radical SAM protein [Streptomyces albireticuli]